jgi:hypothetical protein
MGYVHAEIGLTSCEDQTLARNFIIGEDEIRSIRIRMLVDSGAWMLCINENIQTILQLPYIGERSFQLANGEWVTHNVVGPVEVRFANRQSSCNALVLPGDSEPLLGAIPREEMDVLIHPLRQELIVNPAHPEHAVLRLGGVRRPQPKYD